MSLLEESVLHHSCGRIENRLGRGSGEFNGALRVGRVANPSHEGRVGFRPNSALDAIALGGYLASTVYLTRFRMRVFKNLACLVGATMSMFSVTLHATSQEPTRIDAAWLAKGNTDGVVNLAKYQELLGSLDETNEARPEPVADGGMRLMTTHSVRLGDNTLFELGRFFVDAKQQPMISLECDNPDYYFGLQKSKQDGPFALTQYATGQRSVPLWRQAGGLHSEVYYHLKGAIAALAPDNRANLRVVRFDSASALLIVEYFQVRNNTPFTHQYMIDPSQGWIITQSRVESSKLLSVVDYTYGKVIDKLKFPTGSTISTTLKVKILNEPTFSRVVLRVLEIKRTDKVAADFRLSAFGFPEPVGLAVPPRPTRWYIWIAAAAGVCGALALGFAYFRRRLSARRAAIPGGAT